MSRTDVHRPMHAQWLDPSMRAHFRTHHDHTQGFCDLQAFLDAFAKGDWRRTGCSVQWWSELRLCGCRMCTAQPARHLARRQERYGARRQLRVAVSQWSAGDLDEDLPRAARSTCW